MKNRYISVWICNAWPQIKLSLNSIPLIWYYNNNTTIIKSSDIYLSCDYMRCYNEHGSKQTEVLVLGKAFICVRESPLLLLLHSWHLSNCPWANNYKTFILWANNYKTFILQRERKGCIPELSWNASLSTWSVEFYRSSWDQFIWSMESASYGGQWNL